MDPVGSIVLALALGAAAGLKPTAEQAIKDGYTALKTLIQRKYGQANLDLLEQNPSSDSRKAVVQEDLAQAGAGQDEEVVQLAQALLSAIQRQAPETAGAIGVRLQDIEAASVTLEEIAAAGPGAYGVDISKARLTGDLRIRGVQAGGPDTAGTSPKG